VAKASKTVANDGCLPQRDSESPMKLTPNRIRGIVTLIAKGLKYCAHTEESRDN
jgi:hypothetical protein